MSRFFSIIKYTYKQNIGIIIASAVLSVFICGIYKISFKTTKDNVLYLVNIGVIDNDHSLLSSNYCSYLKEQGINIYCENSEKYLEKRLINQGISAIVYIPAGYENHAVDSDELQKITIKTITKKGPGLLISFLTDKFLHNIKFLIDKTDGDKEYFHQLLSSYSDERKHASDYSDLILQNKELVQKCIIITISFLPEILMAISLFLAFNIVTERQTGLYNRISVSPIRFYHYILGTSFLAIIANILPVVLLFTYIGLNKHVPGHDMLQIFFVCILFALFMVGVALLSGMCCNSQTSAFAVVVSVGAVGTIIGGCFFDLRFTPKFIRFISMLTPHYWMVQGIREAFSDVSKSIIGNIITLLIFNIAIFTMVVIRYNLRVNGKRTIM